MGREKLKDCKADYFSSCRLVEGVMHSRVVKDTRNALWPDAAYESMNDFIKCVKPLVRQKDNMCGAGPSTTAAAQLC